MSVIWSKVWFDIWHDKVRTLLAVLSIAAGVFAVGSTFGLSDQLLSGMDQAHQAVFPSHINMYLDTNIDRDTALALKKVPGVEDVEPCNNVTVRFKVHPEDKWQQGMVAMRDDYAHQKYDVVQLKAGSWPAKNALGIERLSSQYYKIDMGQQVILEIDKQEHTFPINGKVRHPFVPPPQFGGQAVFFIDAEGLEHFHISQGTFGQLLIRVSPYSADYARQVASDVKDRLAKQGIGVAATIYQDPNKHWGRMFVEGITLVMEIMAVVSLFMSVILVLNTLTALITQQTNQIGIIKALGGTTSTVVKLYLTGVLIYGLLALLISLPTGVFLAFGLTKWFLNLFNIDYDVFHYSRQAVIMQVLAAVGVPLLAALWPVLKGAAITVRQAIASYGLGGDFGSSRLDQAVEQTGQRFLPSAYAMALANTFRRKGRLVLSLLVLVTAGVMFMMIQSLSSSLTATLDSEFQRRAYDVSVQFDQLQRIDRAVEMAEAVPGVQKAAVWFIQPATILRQGQKTKEAGLGTDISAVPLNDTMYKPLVVAGRWLAPGDDRAVVLSKETADDNHLKVGDTITLDLGDLGKDDWQIVGLYKVIFGGSFRTDAIYAPQQAVFEATKKYGRGTLMYVRTEAHDAKTTKAIADQVETLFRSRNMRIFQTQTLIEDRQSANSQFQIMVSMLLAISIIVAVVGGIGLTGSLSISVIERTKEIGVLRAIGGRSRTISGMFIMEGVLQGVLSWLISIPISFVAGRSIADLLGRTMFSANLAYQFNTGAVFVWLAVVLVISTIASILPARNASRISVRQSLAYE